MTTAKDQPTKAELEAQVATEAAKRTAAKDAQQPAEKGEQVEVVMRVSTIGSSAGDTRMVDQATAERLVRQGHADYPAEAADEG